MKTKQLKQFIIQYKIDHGGCSPSNREMMEFLGVATTSAVSYHLAKLFEAGELIPGPVGEARMIQVPGIQVVWVG